MFRNIFVNKSILESIISFTLVNWISSGNLQKTFVNNETLQKQITKKHYLFPMITVDFYFLNLHLFMPSVYCRIFLTFYDFCCRYLMINKNLFWKRNHPNGWFYIPFYMSPMNPKKCRHNTTFSAKLPYFARHSL